MANTINTALYERLSFNLLNDIAPVASLMRLPNVVEDGSRVHRPTSSPGRISFASSGVGSSIHMSGELSKAMTKIDRRRPCVQGLFNLLFYELFDSFRCLKATGISLIEGGW